MNRFVLRVCGTAMGLAPAAAGPAKAADQATAPAALDPTVISATIAPTGAADGCELHVWPAERMNSMTTGLLGGGLLDAAVHAKRDSSNKALMATALDSPSQLRALTALDLRQALMLTSGTTIVLHANPVERHTMNKITTRRSDSKASCYSELIVADLFFQKAAIHGRSLRALFLYRDFGNDQTIDRQFKGWGGNGLKLFPPKEGEDAVAALDELSKVFASDFEEYAKNARTALAVPAKKG